MPFRLPAFNVPVNLWNTSSGGPLGPPSHTTMGNLSPGRLTEYQIVTFNGYQMYLRLPAGTDARSEAQGGSPIAEVPAGTLRFYRIVWVDDIGRGFANEHRLAILVQCGAGSPYHWPLPIP